MKNDMKHISYIKEIAEDQKKENDPIKRDDLAYLLCKKFNMAEINGVDLEQLVYDAYRHYDNSDAIRAMIVTNDGSASVVDSAEMREAGLDGISNQLLSIVANDMRDTDNSIKQLQRSLADLLKVELAEDAASLYKWLQGKSGIEEIRAKGSSLMSNYEKMAQNYNMAETSVKRNIHDFVELRSCVNSLFRQYSSMLIDVFGDSVKVIAPELFDFDAVKWLDISGMQQSAKLEYNKLDEKCSLLLGEISQNFNNMLNDASTSALTLRKMSNNGSGGKFGIYSLLLVQAVRCANHLIDANTKKTQLQNQYVRFEDSVKRDKVKVSADMKRLIAIHKTLNDIYIPQADAFARLSGNVFSDDFEQLVASLYSGDEVRELKAERDELLRRCKVLEESINDHQENIALFDYQIEDWKGMIDSQKANYNKAKQEKPSRPNALVKLLSFGYAQRKYEAKITDWMDVYEAFVTEYEDAMLDLTETTDNRKSHTDLLAKNKKEYEEAIARIKEINKQMMSRLQCSTEVRAQVAKHLKDIVSLLYAAKRIAELGLDDKMVNVREVDVADVAILPVDMEQRVSQFVNGIVDSIQQSGSKVAEAVMADLANEFQPDEALRPELVSSVEKASQLFDSWTRLQAMQMKAQLNEEVYRNEMLRLKQEFQQEMAHIDKKSEVLQEALRRANLSVDKEELRKALIDLAGGETLQWSDSDFESFLLGKKVITI